MNRVPLIATIVALSAVVACQHSQTAPTNLPAGSPSTPSSAPRPRETFAVSGNVTNDAGVPIGGAAVTMRYQSSGGFGNVTAVTDASGQYAIEFTSNPWSSTEGRGAARAEIVADGYDWFWRTVWATGPVLVESFRLQRIKRIGPGESAVVSVTRDHGDCLGWLFNPCGRLRVASPEIGTLTLEAEVIAGERDSSALEVCCYAGNEVYGNPVSLHVKAASEMWVEVGQNRSNSVTNQSVLVRTSFKRDAPDLETTSIRHIAQAAAAQRSAELPRPDGLRR
jgi:hypothetical protein